MFNCLQNLSVASNKFLKSEFTSRVRSMSKKMQSKGLKPGPTDSQVMNLSLNKYTSRQNCAHIFIPNHDMYVKFFYKHCS